MWRLAAILGALVVVVLIASSPASAQDRDCSDFNSQADAQDFYEQAGSGDPHQLDADNDGRACDANPCPCRGPGEDDGSDGGGDRPRRFQTIRSTVIRVVDGDTIVIRPLEPTRRSRYRVRLIGIDSPEFSPKECGAMLATEHARRLAPRGRRVLLKTDPTQPMFDRFDRLLAYVRLPSGRQLNRAQIAAGWAKVFVVGRRFQYYSEYRRLARRAKRENRGAWGLCGGSFHRPDTGSNDDPAEPAPAPTEPTDCQGYDPCVPPGPDVDCAGGSGDGPRYVDGPVRVYGSDPYGLDSDGNGVGCETY